ncbi:MAG: hypothetical protein IIC88_06025 [Chloroflexi bacterium]|nr:hypothetical protein [Chloroflexota bacterium]
MPFFESQKSKDQRLFAGQLEMLLQKLSSLMDGEDYKHHSAWVFGGSVAGNVVVASHGSELELLRQAWGKGDSGKARALIEVFTFPMISRWYRNLESQMQVPADQKKLARRISASNILTLFDSSSEDEVDEFMGMDSQFNYERDLLEDKAHPRTRMEEAILLLSKALRACGYPSRVAWTKLELPVEDLRDLAEQLGEQAGELDSLDPLASMAISLSLNAGERAMHDHFRAH